MLTLAELSVVAELVTIEYDELQAVRRPVRSPGEEDPSDGDLAVSATRGPDRIEVRCAIARNTGDADYRVVARGIFVAKEAFDVTDDVMTAFVQQIGVMTLYPFLRQAIHRLSAELVGVPVLLALIQPGQIQLGLQGKSSSN